MKKLILIVGSTFLPFILIAQKNITKDVGTVSESASPVALNHVDNKGNKQGTWLVKQEALRGEPAMTSVGTYKNNKKVGTWYQIDAEGRPISILKYKNNVLDGESKYFENGELVCIGQWRGLNPEVAFDTVWVYNPETDIETQVTVPTEQGSLQHGIWKFYNPETGQLVKEELYQVGEMVKRKEFVSQPSLSEERKKQMEDKVQKQLKATPYKPTKVNPNRTK